MSIISERERGIIRYRLSRLNKKVKIKCFVSEYGCDDCETVRQLAGEMEKLSPKLIFEIIDFDKNLAEVHRYHIDKAPAILIETGPDSRIRFYGMPGGYQMESFLEAIEMVGNEKVDLQLQTLEQLAGINVPVRIQVFVSPKCPYCPAVVIMAHRLALASPHITSEMIEILEFPDIVSHYNVHGVPRVVINESHYFEGVLPEDLYLDEVMKAVAVES